MPEERRLSLSIQVYRKLLLLYPAEHRQTYGTLMVQVFRDSCRDACRQEGAGGLARVWIRTLLDAIPSLMVEYRSALENGGLLNMDGRTARRRHMLAWILAGFPLGLGLVLSLLNPQYMGRMVRFPHSGAQPLGWVLTAGILVLVCLAYLSQRASIALAGRALKRSTVGTILSVGSVLFFVLPAVCLVVFGPALLLLVEAGILGSVF